MGVHRVGALEIDEDLRYQRRAWIIQRVGWLLMALLILAALLGLTGNDGLLADGHAESSDGTLKIDYRRLARKASPSDIRISLQAEAIEGDQVRLWVAQGFFDGFQVENVVPEPESVAVDDERVLYTFAVGEVSDSIAINFNIEWQQVGSASGQIGLEGGPTVALDAFVFP